jgi:hypothetical protein
MKLLHAKVLGLVVAGSLLAVPAGCGRRLFEGGPTVKQVIRNSKNRVVTISYRQGSSGACEVDYPITLLWISKGHTITWVAADHDYYIFFDNGFPIVNATNPIHVPQGGNAGPFTVTIPPPTPPTIPKMYFTYAVYDVPPGPNPSPSAACQTAADDHDTGVNVKR